MLLAQLRDVELGQHLVHEQLHQSLEAPPQLVSIVNDPSFVEIVF